jgi:predicted TIM-barrel fold metal-dependent hydrolase
MVRLRQAGVATRSRWALAMNTIHRSWNDSADAVTLIDAHHHLWGLSRKKHPNLTGEPRHDFFMGDDSALRRDYLPPDYLRDAAGHNLLTTVHCEAEWDRADQLGETAWIGKIHEQYGFPGAIVAHAWFDTDNAEEIIAAQAAFPLVRGIRSKPVTAPTPDRIEPGAPGTMQDERWLRGFALLEKYRLSWDLRVPFWHLEEAAMVARAFPNTPIVLNHTGFPWDRSEAGLAAWRRAMAVLAREPNVHVKVSEFGLVVPGLGLRGQPPRGARRTRHLRHRAGDVREQFSGCRAARRIRRAGCRDAADAGSSVARAARPLLLEKRTGVLPPVTPVRIR